MHRGISTTTPPPWHFYNLSVKFYNHIQKKQSLLGWQLEHSRRKRMEGNHV